MNSKIIITQLKGALKGFQIPERDFSKIGKHIEIRQIKEGESFCTKNKVCKNLGILFEGLLMAHYDTEEKDINVSRFFFAPHNMIVTSFDSFRDQAPSTEEIVAIEDSKLACISFENLNTLYEEVPALNKIGRLLAEESYVNALQRIHDLQVLDNKQRVIKFYTSHKDLYNRLEKQHIASYLSINRNDLSKIITEYNNRGQTIKVNYARKLA